MRGREGWEGKGMNCVGQSRQRPMLDLAQSHGLEADDHKSRCSSTKPVLLREPGPALSAGQAVV